jgi:hypothetical protein
MSIGDRPAVAQPTVSSPSLVVAAQAVTAGGMTPGGDVVWFAMVRKVQSYEASYGRQQGVVQADAQGQVQIVSGGAVPPLSIWVVVDLATGAYAMASPDGFSPLTFDLTADALAVSADAGADQLVDVADHAEVLLVRPGKGAWGKSIGRGGADDVSNAADTAYRLPLDRLAAIRAADGPAAGKFLAGDLVVVVHPEAMAIGFARFGGKS